MPRPSPWNKHGKNQAHMEMTRMIPGSQGTFPFSKFYQVMTFQKQCPTDGPWLGFEFGMVLNVMKGDVNLNVNTGSNSQMIP